jgi:GGDEF domain-containing protein
MSDERPIEGEDVMRVVRMSVVPGALILAAMLIKAATSHPAGGEPSLLLSALASALMALAVCSWVVSSTTMAVGVGVLTVVGLGWVWLTGQIGGLWLVAFGVMLGTSLWHRRRWDRRRHRMRQILEDVSEEQRVKDQAVEIAGQAQETLQKKLARYRQLQTIAEELSNMTDLGAIAQLAVDRTFSLIGKSDTCLLFLIDQERQELSLAASRKQEASIVIRAKHGDQFDRHVLRSHTPLLVNDAKRDFRFTVSASPERDVCSVIACPLMMGQSPVGLLRLDSARSNVYSQDDLRLLDILLDLLSSAVTNAKLFARTQQLAMTDGLTGLMLRRPFLETLARELIRSGRSHDPVSILLVDVDHFKPYNDTFGHTAGDRVLKEVAVLLQSVVPAGGVIARYGGEEFVALLPACPRPQAVETAERARDAVARYGDGGSRAGLPDGRAAFLKAEGLVGQAVTVSVGVAAFPDDAQGELELIRVADQRLYQAKREGRNRVCAS